MGVMSITSFPFFLDLAGWLAAGWLVICCWLLLAGCWLLAARSPQTAQCN